MVIDAFLFLLIYQPLADYLSHYLRMNQKIPLGARILAVADTFAAMTSNRAYRKGLSKEAAIEELKRAAGTQLDPELVKVFVEMLMSREGK